MQLLHQVGGVVDALSCPKRDGELINERHGCLGKSCHHLPQQRRLAHPTNAPQMKHHRAGLGRLDPIGQGC